MVKLTPLANWSMGEDWKSTFYCRLNTEMVVMNNWHLAWKQFLQFLVGILFGVAPTSRITDFHTGLFIANVFGILCWTFPWSIGVALTIIAETFICQRKRSIQWIFPSVYSAAIDVVHSDYIHSNARSCKDKDPRN